MASGKLGEIALSRKHYHGYGTNEVDRGYDYSCQYREKEKVGRDGYMIRDKDGRKDGIDDWCYSSSSGRRSYNNGSGRSRFNNKVEDREPGELSSGSGSEGSDVIDVRDIEAVLPPRKKQKFSPVVWDKEEKKVNGGVKRSIVQIGSLLNHTAKHPHQSPEVASPLGSSPVLPEECCRTSHQEVEQLEEDGFITGMNIPVSRWADVDEDEGNEVMCGKGKHLSTSGSSLTSLSSKLSPEVEEFNSENGHGSECSSQFNRINNAEVKEDDVQNKNTCYGYDTDSEEENEYLATPDPMSPHQGNMLHSSRSVHDFERLKKIGAGTYGIVYQCRDKLNGEVVALKKVKMEKEKEGFPMSSLREINILTSLRHPSIVEVKEVVVEEDVKYGKSETYLVMEYMEHDLKGLIEAMKQPFSQSEVKCLMLQLLEGVEYLHDNWVLHRDLKTSNLLLNNRGELKICDFGLSRQYGSPLKPYTPLVVTLWYRAPELLLGAKQYSTAIDMWSLGCIMAELLTKKPLFSGESEIDQLNKIFKTLGTPTETNLPGFSKLPGAKVNFVKQKYNVLREKFPPRSFIGTPYLTAAGFDLLDRLLTYDPEKRIKAADAVNHEWFREVPLPKAKEFMPTFPAQHDKSRY